MHKVAYAGDESSGSELTYCNEVGQSPPYDECIVFKSSFHSVREGAGAWNPDFEYEDWQWILGIANGKYENSFPVHSRPQVRVSADDINGFKACGVIEHAALP